MICKEMIKDIKQLLNYNTSVYISKNNRLRIIEMIEMIERLEYAKENWGFTIGMSELYEYIKFGRESEAKK